MSKPKIRPVLGLLLAISTLAIMNCVENAAAIDVDFYRHLEYEGQDYDIISPPYCAFSFSQVIWDNSSIDIDENDYNNIYLYAKCTVFNNNHAGQHWYTKLQYDVWFYYNDPSGSGSSEQYYTGYLTEYNVGQKRSITPWYVYQDMQYNIQEGDTLTIIWELNIAAYDGSNNLMGSTWTRVYVDIDIV